MKHLFLLSACLILVLAACNKDDNTGNNNQQQHNNTTDSTDTDTTYHAASHTGNYLVTTKRYRWQYVAGDTTYFTPNDTLIITSDSSGTLTLFSYSTAITLTRNTASSATEVYTGGGSPERSLMYYATRPDSVSGHFKVTSTHYVTVDSFWGHRMQ